jgi:uncharacterized membrane protein
MFIYRVYRLVSGISFDGPETDRSQIDLYTVIATVGATLAIVGLDVAIPFVRPVLAGVLVFVLPGYALLVATYPETDAHRRWYEWRYGETVHRGATLDRTAMAALTIGLSCAISAFVGLGLNLTPWGISTWSVAAVLSGVTVLLVSIAWTNRRRHSRVSTPEASPGSGLTATERRDSQSTPRRVASVVLVASLLVSLLSVGVLAGTRTSGEQFTEFSMAINDGGPSSSAIATAGTNGSRTVTLTVSNHERRTVEYTIVTTVTERAERRVLSRNTLELESGETTRLERQLPSLSASGRVNYLLYRGSAPAEPTTANAYREVHRWIDADNRTADS